MIVRVLIVLSIISVSFNGFGKPYHLNIGVNSPGTPPHLYYSAKEGKYVGVLPDLLSQAIADGALTVDFVDSHRNRSEPLLRLRDIDGFLSSLGWLKRPEEVIATQPIMINKGYLFSLNPIPESIDKAEYNGERVCTRRGYSYPKLESYFSAASLVRIDSSSHVSMLNMLLKKRCHYAYIALDNFKSLINYDEFSNTAFYRTDRPIEEIEVVLILHPSKSIERDIVNSYVHDFIESGLLHRSLARHSVPAI